MTSRAAGRIKYNETWKYLALRLCMSVLIGVTMHLFVDTGASESKSGYY